MAETPKNQLQVVYIVTCYQNVVDVFASQEDAAHRQREFVQKGRPADVLCRSIVYPL